MKWLFVAGGTGGHVFPALVIAEMLREKYPQDSITFLVRPHSIEDDLVSRQDYQKRFIKGMGINGRGLLKKIQGIAFLVIALFRAFKLLRVEKPEYIFGVGGYLSGPILILARLFKIRSGILEPNAYPGFSNRILATRVDHVFVAFKSAEKYFSKRANVMWVGNPIRRQILNLPAYDVSKRDRLIIFGGSQGAKQINDWMIQILPVLKDKAPNLKIIHQTGKADLERVSKAYQNTFPSAVVKDFFEDMHEVYRNAKLAVARAGSSILELSACGIPCILIPYPYAADGHQDFNAAELAEIGAAKVLSGRNDQSDLLAKHILTLLSGEDALSNMSRAAILYRRENAALNIIENARGAGK